MLEQTVYWDIDSLEQMAKSLEKERNNLVNACDEFTNQREALNSAWVGAAGEIADLRLEEDKRNFENAYCKVDVALTAVKWATEQYRKCESDALNRVRSVGAGG